MKTKSEDFTQEERLEICKRLGISESALKRRISVWGVARAISQPGVKGKEALKAERTKFFQHHCESPNARFDNKQSPRIGDQEFCAHRKQVNKLALDREEQRLLEQACQEVWDEPLEGTR